MPSPKPNRLETDLFPPIKAYLQGQGYSVHSEVRGADLVAKNEDHWIAVELKTKMSLKLLYQGVSLQESMDSVYLAVALEGSQAVIPNYKDLRKTLLRLGLGLLAVRFLRGKSRVEVLIHPGEEKKRSRPSKKRGMIREIDGRYAELNLAGETSSVEKFTAYKQQCLLIAWALKHAPQEGLSPKDLRDQGLPNRCGNLLGQNLYGWYQRISRGRYALSSAGSLILTKNQKIIERIVRKFSRQEA